uniref:Uncharacterized protein n=1 Tax=Amphora coffeiformis TaxID=265554 RepID=A0A7S3P7L8_9STRA|mmetsp:Transcript_15739/g.30000  ORF Transcript_15739/g.30000 Transcript_15739/m.30000 type:complete len:232 (-) Transcript_15739:144-839(-)|eukprot:scaffold1717_cov169-Amphora_coffeaeformis.AAC.7
MFESVLSTNFDAVSLMKIGRFDESIYLLKLAIAAVQNAGQQEHREDEGALGMVVSVPLEYCDRLSKFTSSTTEVSFSGICNRAFIFQGSQSLANMDENASLCASVGLYNMALNMHLKGLTIGGPACLSKASGLYKRVFTILRSYALFPIDSVSSLLLATVLNIVACESELKGYCDDSTQQWMKVYNDLFAWATTQSDCESAAILQHPEEIDLFASSSVFFAGQNFCTAAAA